MAFLVVNKLEDEVEVSLLRLFPKGDKAKKKWMQIWEEIGERILKLPQWMQNIVLEDVKTAVNNRVSIMEMIDRGRRK